MRKAFGSTLLIVGTSIGAGMLALPVATGNLGFFLSATLICGIAWIMYQSALCMLECSLHFGGTDNVLSMARNLAGRPFYISVFIANIALLSVLQVAYLSAATQLIGHLAGFSTSSASVHWLLPLCIAGIVGVVLFVGIKHLDPINRIIVIVLLGTVLLLSVLMLPHFKITTLQHFNTTGSFNVLPLLALSFGFHPLIPSLVHYQDNNKNSLKSTLRWGFILIAGTYLAWQLALLGSIQWAGPFGLHALTTHKNQLVSLTQAVQHLTGTPWIGTCFTLISLTAITSSFLGVALSLKDCLHDGLSKLMPQQSTLSINLGATLLSIVPPLLIYFSLGHIFVVVLQYASLPALYIILVMPAWLAHRYRQQHSPKAHQRLTRTWIPLSLIAIATLLIIAEIQGLSFH